VLGRALKLEGAEGGGRGEGGAREGEGGGREGGGGVTHPRGDGAGAAHVAAQGGATKADFVTPGSVMASPISQSSVIRSPIRQRLDYDQQRQQPVAGRREKRVRSGGGTCSSSECVSHWIWSAVKSESSWSTWKCTGRLDPGTKPNGPGRRATVQKS